MAKLDFGTPSPSGKFGALIKAIHGDEKPLHPTPIEQQHAKALASMVKALGPDPTVLIGMGSLKGQRLRIMGVDPKQFVKALGEVPNEQIKSALTQSEASRRNIPNAPAGAMAHAGANVSRPVNGRLPHTARREYQVSIGDRELTETQARHHVAKAMRDGHITPDEATRCEGHFNLRRQLPRDLAAKLLVTSSK